MGQKAEFYPKLKNLIETLGEWNINFSQLSRDWNVPKSTLCRWNQEIIKEIGVIDLSRAGREIEHAFIHNLKVCRELLVTDNKKTKMDAIKVFNDTQKAYTEFMESYGKKNKIAEKIDINNESKSMDESIKQFQELMEEWKSQESG